MSVINNLMTIVAVQERRQGESVGIVAAADAAGGCHLVAVDARFHNEIAQAFYSGEFVVIDPAGWQVMS